MSASSTTRLARLISRVAQERAARGRPAQISRPHVARQGFRRREDDDGDRRSGTAADFVSFDVDYGILGTPRSVQRIVRIVDAEGRYLGDTVIEMPTRLRVLNGIDYAGLLGKFENQFAGEPQIIVSPPAPEPIEPAEKELIDILFPEA